MDSANPLDQLATSSANLPLRINELFDAAGPSALYGRRASTTTGLTWGYYGGRLNGTSVAHGTVSLTDNTANNYVVALRSSGAVSVATNTTNWNNTKSYLRLYRITTASGVVTDYQDWRAGVGGRAVQLDEINVFTQNQSVSRVTLTSAASVAVNAALSNNFRLVLGTNATLANPTNATSGMHLNFRIKQDATGGRTLAYGTAYKFPGGVAPTLSAAANAVDELECSYDSTDATWTCHMRNNFS